VVGRDQRPRLELPRVGGAELWTIGTAFKPISATGIGTVVSGENVFVTRLRIVPRRIGPLDIPPMVARIDDRSGRSRQVRLMIETVPPEGRPAAFLGGVGEFSVQAEAAPAAVRVGEEFTYRIKVSGPAAWGMTSRPDLARFGRLAVSPRIEPRPDETVNEPPSRTFVYRIRPTRPGDAVLPPVTIATFDPELMRYITKATQGVPIKAVAVAAFDPGTLDYTAPDTGRDGRLAAAWARAGAVLVLLLGASGLVILVQRRRIGGRRSGPLAARRFAHRLARRWKIAARLSSQEGAGLMAREIIEDLIAYGRIGTGRPPGALTPADARHIILELTRSLDLADQGARLVARCDRALFSERSTASDAERLGDDARALFTSLGQVSMAQAPHLSEWQDHETA
jgi:hypothetical protein